MFSDSVVIERGHTRLARESVGLMGDVSTSGRRYIWDNLVPITPGRGAKSPGELDKVTDSLLTFQPHALAFMCPYYLWASTILFCRGGGAMPAACKVLG